MKYLNQISFLIIAAQWCGEVTCKPFVKRKHILKTYYFGLVPLPPKHVSLMFEKITPFGKYEFKHSIKKRQTAQVELPSSIANEVGAVDHPLKVPMTHLLESTEVKDVEKLPAEVFITSVVEPLEPGKPISFLLPVDSEVVITPALKDIAPPVPLSVEVPVGLKPEVKPDVVAPLASGIISITPKPIEIAPPKEVELYEPNVVLTTSIENTVPPVPLLPPIPPVPPLTPIHPPPTIPLVPVLPVENPLPPKANTPDISPVINSIPIAPFLYTNIKGIPFYTPAANIIPFITPGAVPIPEAIIPPSPPTVIEEILPVVKEEIPPVVKEDPPPNFFVKSSRFVLYFGSMMLQMLSRFVNGQVNLNQIPLLPPFPGMQ